MTSNKYSGSLSGFSGLNITTFPPILKGASIWNMCGSNVVAAVCRRISYFSRGIAISEHTPCSMAALDPWLIATVLGFPVVPEVCTMYSISPACTARHGYLLTAGTDCAMAIVSTDMMATPIHSRLLAWLLWHTIEVMPTVWAMCAILSMGKATGSAQYTQPFMTRPARIIGSSKLAARFRKTKITGSMIRVRVTVRVRHRLV